MNVLKLIIRLSRPRFWLYLAGPYLLGYTFAYDHTTSFLTPKSVYTFLYFLIPANIFLYGVNDIFDRETDKINPKKDSKEQKITLKTYSIYLYIVIFSLCMAIPLFIFQNRLSNLLLALFLIFSYLYSAPPIRFKIKPFVDSASNILYALPAFIGFSQLVYTAPNYKILLVAWLWTFGMHLYSAIPDIEYDKKAHMQTTAVYLGEQKSLWLCFVIWLIMAVLTLTISPLFILSFIYPLTVFLVIKKITLLEDMYWRFPYINALAGFILYVYAYNS